MGSGNIDVGNETPTRKPGQPVVEDLSGTNGSELRIDPSLKTERQGNTQGKIAKEKPQRIPRAFVARCRSKAANFAAMCRRRKNSCSLVGCRERKVGTGLEARQYSNPVKR